MPAGVEPRPIVVLAPPQPIHNIPAPREQLKAHVKHRYRSAGNGLASTGYKDMLKIKCLARTGIKSPELDTGAIKLQEHFVKP